MLMGCADGVRATSQGSPATGSSNSPRMLLHLFSTCVPAWHIMREASGHRQMHVGIAK